GDATARGLMASMEERSWDPDAFTHLIAPPKAREAHRSLAQLLRQLRTVAGGSGDDGGARIASDIMAIRALYDSILKERYDRPEGRVGGRERLRTSAAVQPSCARS